MTIKKIIFIVAGVIALICGVFYAMHNKTESNTDAIIDNTNDNTNENTEITVAESETAIFCVYVCGSVNSPGVYYLDENSRIADAITEAGGLLDGARPEAVNLADYIQDGMKIYIPDESEGTTVLPMDGMTGGGLVNINTADAALLMTLPGIGASRADAIIMYRNDNGQFGTIEDIMLVSGIKDAAFNKIKDLICV